MASLKLFIALCALVGYASAQAYNTNGDVVAEFEVYCDDNDLAVFFNRTALDERDTGDYNNRTYQIYFAGQRDDASCTTYAWDTSKRDSNYNSISHPSANIPANIHIGAGLKSCGINVFADNDHIIYNTTVIVTYGQNPSGGVIGREEHDEYQVMCLRNRTIEKDILSSYDVQYRQTGSDAKNDTEDYEFTFVHRDMNFISQSSYKLGDYIQFELTSNTSQTDVKAVIQKCWTNDGTSASYTLITGCTLEPGTSWISVSDSVSKWKTEAFRWLGGAGNTVYTECLVRMCLDSQSGGECDLCTVSKRKRRSADEEGEHTVGQMILVRTPSFYIVDAETPTQGSQGSSSVLSGTNGLIVIILLATLVFVIAAAIIKKVFFSPAAVPVATPVVAYSNKAMA